MPFADTPLSRFDIAAAAFFRHADAMRYYMPPLLIAAATAVYRCRH